MTTYRLWPSASGPALVSYTSTPFISGVQFAVSGGGKWFEGYYIWVPTGGDTAPSGGYTGALWSSNGGGGGFFVPGSKATLATATANAWNFIALTNPVQLAPGWDQNSTASGSIYVAAVGWTPSQGFPDTNSYWASGGTGGAGITNGPLIAYSSNNGTANKCPYSLAQGVFSTAGADPSVHMPVSNSNDANFGVDVLVSDTAPAGYAGSYRLWPNKCDSNFPTTGDLNVNYTVATEVSLSQQCALNNVWYFSPNGTGSAGTATTLATRADVWSVASGLMVASITSPAWKKLDGTTASAGAGWVSAAFAPGTTLPAGDYRVSVFNSAGTTDANWSAKDAATDYFGETATNSVGAAGITNGPVSAPNYAGASSGYLYAAGSPGTTPPYSNGTVPHAQPPFGQNPGGTVQNPVLYAPVGGGSNQTQNYWVDLEATPLLPVALPPQQFSARGRPGRRGRSAGSPAPLTHVEDVPPVASGAAVRGRAGRRGRALGSPAPLAHLEDVPPVTSGAAVRGRPGRRGSSAGSRPATTGVAAPELTPAPATGAAVRGRRARRGTAAGSPPPLVRLEEIPAAATGRAVTGRRARKGTSAGSPPPLVAAFVQPQQGTVSITVTAAAAVTITNNPTWTVTIVNTP